MAQARCRGCRLDASWVTHADGFRARCDSDINVGDVERGRGEAGGVVDGGAACARRGPAARVTVALRDDEEPSHGKNGSVGSIDERVADVEGGEREAVEGRLGADVRRQERGENQRQHRVYVHGQLEWREVQPRQQRK